MLPYVFKRLLIFVPILVVVSLLAFGLSKMAPGDPAAEILDRANPLQGGYSSLANYQRDYNTVARQLGLDKPSFYFSITSQAYPDTLFKIPNRFRSEAASKLVAQYGNWPQIAAYLNSLKRFEYRVFHLPNRKSDPVIKVKRTVNYLFGEYKDAEIGKAFRQIKSALEKDSLLISELGETFDNLTAAYISIKDKATPYKLMMPDFKWYGFDNQYHHWLLNFLRGDFGISYEDKRPVAGKLRDALFWTLIMNSTAIFLAFLIAIPLGVVSAVRKDSFFERATTLGLFVLYSLPVFWVGTMLLIFFSTPDYGMDFFDVGLPYFSAGTPFWTRFWSDAWHLVLPVFCLTYASLAFISRQMRGGMLTVLRQDYIRTARAKGLSEKRVIWKHAFRNSLFPIITLLASIFPRVLAGSVIVEYIFNIHGMGGLILDAIYQNDYPVVYSVLMLSAILTMVGILVADILYALADPRVSYTKSNKS